MIHNFLGIKLHPIIQPQTGKSSHSKTASAVNADCIFSMQDLKRLYPSELIGRCMSEYQGVSFQNTVSGMPPLPYSKLRQRIIMIRHWHIVFLPKQNDNIFFLQIFVYAESHKRIC